MSVIVGGGHDPEYRIKRITGGWERKFRRDFIAMIQRVANKHTLNELAALIEAGKIAEALSELEAAAIAFGETYGAAYVDSASKTGRFLTAGILTVEAQFDKSNVFAVREIARAKLDLIRGFIAPQRNVTRAAIQRGVVEGHNPIQQARTFRASIGLTDYQMQQVINFRNELTSGRNGLPSRKLKNRQLRDKRFDPTIDRAIRNNEPLTIAQIEKQTDAYQRRYVKYRSEVIARTEALRAVQQGKEEMYRQGIERQLFRPDQIVRKWVAASDGRTRDSHVYLHGQIRAHGEGWQGLHGFLRYPCDPAAPAAESVQCRCSISTLILDKDQADEAIANDTWRTVQLENEAARRRIRDVNLPGDQTPSTRPRPTRSTRDLFDDFRRRNRGRQPTQIQENEARRREALLADVQRADRDIARNNVNLTPDVDDGLTLFPGNF